MAVASFLLIGLSESVLEVNDVSSFEDMSTFTGRLAHAALSSTVPNASYLDKHGLEIVQRDISVQSMVIQELLLLHAGVPIENFQGPDRFNDRIESVLSALAGECPYFYALRGEYQRVEILITNSNLATNEKMPRTEMASYISEVFLQEGERITITIQVWLR